MGRGKDLLKPRLGEYTAPSRVRQYLPKVCTVQKDIGQLRKVL